MINDLHKVFKGCKRGKVEEQKKLFVHFQPLMLGICERYCQNTTDAQDIMQEGFIKIFKSIDSFKWKNESLFIGWMKRIMINLSIDHYRTATKYEFSELPLDTSYLQGEDTDEVDIDVSDNISIDVILNSGVTIKELLTLLQELPNEFRIVFNLFVIEGYKHKEIAEIIDIPIKTSTTRLLRAKKLLRKEIHSVLKSKLQDAG